MKNSLMPSGVWICPRTRHLVLQVLSDFAELNSNLFPVDLVLYSDEYSASNNVYKLLLRLITEDYLCVCAHVQFFIVVEQAS